MKKSILFMVFTITLTSVSCSNNIERVSPKAVVSSATVDKSSDSYTLTKYDNTKIRFYLQEYDNKNKTKEDLSEIYKIYGTAKIKHVRQEMNKEFQQNRLEQKMKRKKKLEKEALERKRNLILKSCNKNLNEELLSYIDKVPDDIINVILNMGYHIELVKNPGEEFNMRYICGLTIPNKKRILIQANKYSTA